MATIYLNAREANRRRGSDGEVLLGHLGRGSRGEIVRICPTPEPERGSQWAAELERRLLEIGFVEGARFEILHEGLIGGDPIAVRIDDTRIALRRRDAMAVVVQSDA
ncbi:MAG: FeoA family protein [Rhizomicrobium sp.]